MGKLRDKVECPVCLSVPREAPIYVCSNGHVVCPKCVGAKCPTCRDKMAKRESSTSTLAVTVVHNIDHQCNYCGLYFHLESLAQHKRECSHRQVKCPSFNCDTMISLSSVKDHVVNIHVAKIFENMPCIIDYKWDAASIPVDRECSFQLKGISFEDQDKFLFLKIILRPLQGRHRWVFYIHMAGNTKETSNFAITMELPGEGKYYLKYSGDIFPIDISSVDEAENQGYCLTVMDGVMSKLFVKDTSGAKNLIRVRVNIVKNSQHGVRLY